MTLRSKAIGCAAALALSISIICGVSAEETVGLTADFKPNPDGVCTVMADRLEADLGTYTWDGGTYVGSPGSGAATLNLTVTQTIAPLATCDVAVSLSPAGIINAGAIQASVGENSPILLRDTSLLLLDDVTGAYTANLTFTPSNEIGVGTYDGTMTFTTGQGS